MRILVLGAGYAGLTVARKLEDALPDDDVVVVDDTGEHLVQHEVHRVIRKPRVADHITVDLEDVLDTAEVREGVVVDVDPDAREVRLADDTVLDYDVAAICLGSETAFYDLPGLREHATPCKRVEHARQIRESVLAAVDDGDGHAVVGGAGLSGVQVAGELAALGHEDHDDDSRQDAIQVHLETDAADADDDAGIDASDDAGIDASDDAGIDASDDAGIDASDDAGIDASDDAGTGTGHQSVATLDGDELDVTIVEMEDSVAPSFPENFQTAVHETLLDHGIDVRTNATVERATDDHVELADGTELAYDTLVWTGGIQGPAATDGERVGVRADLRVGSSTFVVGDAGDVVDADGEAVPASAQSAIREARVAAANIERLVEHRRRADPGAFQPKLDRFAFNSPGWVVSIGNEAVAKVGPGVITGRAAVALKATVGAGYLSGVGALRQATDLVNDELGLDPGTNN